MDKNHELYQGKKAFIDIGMRVNARKGIGFSFSEKHLSISSDEGLSLTIQGMPIKISHIEYFEQSGKFRVKTDTPMGIGEKTLNQKIEQVLNEHYRPKMIRAFKELKSIKDKKSLQDVNQVVATVAGIFSSGKNTPIPTVRGNVQLQFYPGEDKNLKLDKWKAQIKKNDSITTGMDFIRDNNKLSVTGIEVRSHQGIRISGKTNFPEIASVNFKHLRADKNGVVFNYDIGAEEIVTGFMILINVVKAYSGHPGNLLKECDPVKLEAIRKSIDGNLKREIAEMIRTHRKALMNAGASRELLAALD